LSKNVPVWGRILRLSSKDHLEQRSFVVFLEGAKGRRGIPPPGSVLTFLEGLA